MKVELAADGGNARATWRRLKDVGYRLTKCEITDLYIVAGDRGGAQYDFLQGAVALEEERLDCELFEPRPWREPLSLQDLLRDDGPILPADQRVLVRPPAYRLEQFVDVACWLEVADALEEVRREAFKARNYRVTTSYSPGISTSVTKTADEVFPGWDQWPPKHRRYFSDWQRSSASVARLCEHWILDLTDWTDAAGMRTLTMIPQWAFNRALAKVDSDEESDAALYAALGRLDQRVGVPFGWFFYMLHGNRVAAEVGERVIRAAEAGTIVIPERDYHVLKDWQEQPYSF